MSCMENIEVYIPKGACVKTIPVQSLSTSTARKIGVSRLQNGSETSEKQMSQTVMWISPVELREKEVTVGKDSRDKVPVDQRPLVTKITAGQFCLPVVSSSITAFKVLRKILTAHKAPIRLSETVNDATSVPCSSRSSNLRQNAFIVFNSQIFLSVKKRKSQGRQVSAQNSVLASSSVLPVSPSPLDQQDATSKCQEEALKDTPPSTHEIKIENVQTPVTEVDNNKQISAFLYNVSKDMPENMPEQCCTDEECQKVDGSTSYSCSQTSPAQTPENQKSKQNVSLEISYSQPDIIQESLSPHTSRESEQPMEADGEGETLDENECLETAVLPKVESCLMFDFDQLAKEERINHLRARLRQKEAALNIFNSKPADQM
ncbi:uncharacterized protein si:dkeyp-110g5.4 [Xyrauchen texanus]|uniref:uncharacterized protein si:dkeyp-110g5.4 n=1 Tax=Xyrauchen texanus TaxID=154827 RepID=UPI0022422919|nr:uncharacterized protein si:dkeyp-110g5.4 [Xyrauchen texanus]XP_051950340.1 uncharacterized protein si:dkeyp-110g5.4 [Xyrauchen texanus]